MPGVPNKLLSIKSDLDPVVEEGKEGSEGEGGDEDGDEPKLENHLETRQSTGRRKEDEPAKEKERRKEAEIQFSTRKQSSLLMHPLRQSLPLTHRALQPQQALQELIPWACLSLSVKTEDADDDIQVE